MPGPHSALKRRQRAPRLGLRARRVSVRSHVPRYWYWLAGVAAMLLGMGLLLGYQMIWEDTQQDGEADLRQQLSALKSEVDRLNGLVGTAPNAVLIEAAARQTLTQKLEKAEADVARLREELNFCEKSAKRDAAARPTNAPLSSPGTIPTLRGTNPP